MKGDCNHLIRTYQENPDRVGVADHLLGFLYFSNMEEKEIQLAKPNRTSTNLCVFSSIEGFETGQRIAQALNKSTLVPTSFQGDANFGSCIIALDLAARMGLNPLQLMQGLYVVHGKPSFSGQFVAGLVNSSGLYKTKLKYEQVGTPGQPDFGYRCYATDWDGDKVYGPAVTMQMAASEGWTSKNPKWKTMSDLMLRYRAASFFQRTNAPELTFGIPTREEVEDTNDVVDIPPHEIVDVDMDNAPVQEAKPVEVKPKNDVPPIKNDVDF